MNKTTKKNAMKTLSAAQLAQIGGGLLSAYNQAETLYKTTLRTSFCDDMTIAE